MQSVKSNAMRNPNLAKIHIAKKQLALDDATYRAMLQAHGGASSAKDLTPAGAAKVLAHLKRCGFKPVAGTAKRARPAGGRDRKDLIGKIEAQLAEAQRPWTYADSMAKRICKVDRIDFCEPEHLLKIIAALSYDAKRHGRGHK